LHLRLFQLFKNAGTEKKLLVPRIPLVWSYLLYLTIYCVHLFFTTTKTNTSLR